MITAQKGMQQKVLESKADFILIGAGRGGGMTTAMMLHARHNARKAGFYGEYWDDSNASKWTRDSAIDVFSDAEYKESCMRFYFNNRSRFSFRKDQDKTPDCVYLEDISRKPEEFLTAWDYDKIVASCHIDHKSWLGVWMKEQELYKCDELMYIYINDDLSKMISSNCIGLLKDIVGDSSRIKSFEYIHSDLEENTALINSDTEYIRSIREKTIKGSW